MLTVPGLVFPLSEITLFYQYQWIAQYKIDSVFIYCTSVRYDLFYIMGEKLIINVQES